MQNLCHSADGAVTVTPEERSLERALRAWHRRVGILCPEPGALARHRAACARGAPPGYAASSLVRSFGVSHVVFLGRELYITQGKKPLFRFTICFSWGCRAQSAGRCPGNGLDPLIAAA